MAPDPIDLLRRMWRIRAFEEKVSELYAAGRIKGLLHLGIGQEAIAVGAATSLSPGDVVFGTHRTHAHALAMGADPMRLMAELAGRSTGYAGGKGGSMHLAIPEIGFVTATGVVGGGIPLALGAAFASRVLGRDSIAVAFFGDGAGQTGSFHESLNLAALWQLPVLFFCENNGYAEFTPLSAHTPIERLAIHAATYGIPAATVDGNDVIEVHAAVTDAAGRVRAGEGPRFIEALTYPGRSVRDRRVDLDDVVAVDRGGRDAVGGRMDGQALDGRVGRERRELGVAVVLAHENHRQPPETSDVERLMKRPGLTGAVAEKDHGDLALLFLLRREGRAQRQRYRPADHAGGGDEAGFFRDDMHRAAFAAAVAGGAPGDFRQKPADVGAFGDGMAMRAMTTVDEVIGAKKAASADGDGFLTDT
jgi:pyruvate dehydrogenase E1 component alpha subunit